MVAEPPAAPVATAPEPEPEPEPEKSEFDREAASENASDWYKDPKVRLVLETFNGDIVDVRLKK